MKNISFEFKAKTSSNSHFSPFRLLKFEKIIDRYWKIHYMESDFANWFHSHSMNQLTYNIICTVHSCVKKEDQKTKLQHRKEAN